MRDNKSVSDNNPNLASTLLRASAGGCGDEEGKRLLREFRPQEESEFITCQAWLSPPALSPLTQGGTQPGGGDAI